MVELAFGADAANQGDIEEAPVVSDVLDEGQIVAALEPGEQAPAEYGSINRRIDLAITRQD